MKLRIFSIFLGALSLFLLSLFDFCPCYAECPSTPQEWEKWRKRNLIEALEDREVGIGGSDERRDEARNLVEKCYTHAPNKPANLNGCLDRLEKQRGRMNMTVPDETYFQKTLQFTNLPSEFRDSTLNNLLNQADPLVPASLKKVVDRIHELFKSSLYKPVVLPFTSALVQSA